MSTPTSPRFAGRRAGTIAALIAALLAGCGNQSSPAIQLAEARQLAARGETRSAIIGLKNLVRSAPQDAGARLALGQLYLDTGDVASAEKELRRALAQGMAAAEVMPSLGQAMLLQGRFAQLLDQLPATLALQQPRLQALRGHALLGLQRSDEAASLFASILRAYPEHPAALIGQARIALQDPGAAQGLAQALALTEQALTRTPKEVDAWRLKADLLRLKGDTAGALAAYRRALALHPALVQAHVDIASMQIASGQPAQLAQAAKELALARTAAPDSLMLLYTQALLDVRQGKLRAAHEQLQRVLRAAPEHLPSHLLMGLVLRGLGAYPQAQQHLRKFLEANPGQPYASKMLASVMMQGGDAQQALALIAPLLAQADPQRSSDAELSALAGELSLRLGRYDDAVAYFERASAQRPQQAMLRTALAMSRLGQGDGARAIAELEQAIQLDDKSLRTGVLLVLARLRARDYDGALASAQRMTAGHGDNAMAHNLAGGVQLLKRDYRAARTSFERALDIDPLFLPAHDNLTRLDLIDGQPQRARQRLERLLARDPHKLDVMTALASLALATGQPAVARSWLERGVRAVPGDVEATLRLARLLASPGMGPDGLAQAVLMLEKLAASKPDHPQVLAQLATWQERSGKRGQALDTWERLSSVQPQALDVQLHIADLRTATGDLDGAHRALANVINQGLAPGAAGGETRARAQLALVRLLIRQQAWAPALQAVRSWQKAAPGDAFGIRLEADILLARRQWQPAIALYRKAFALQPDAAMLIPLYSAQVQAGWQDQACQRMQQWLDSHDDDRITRLFYANSLMAERDFKASVVQFEHLHRQTPDQALVLNNLAWLYQQLGDDRALPTAERAIAIAPDNPVVLDTLGGILAGQGQLRRAVGYLKRAAQLAPDHADIRSHLEAATTALAAVPRPARTSAR